MMRTSVKAAWVGRLLNMTEEQHGKGLLKDGELYCPLGVLCQVYSEVTGTPWVDTGVDGDGYKILGNNKILPGEVKVWAGLRSTTVFLDVLGGRCHIPELNDQRGYTFKQFADLIAAQL